MIMNKSIMNEKSGATMVLEAMISAALLNCKCGSRKSLVEKVAEITNNRFEVTVISGPIDESDTSRLPFVLSLRISDAVVFIMFTVSETFYIRKIEVEEM